MTGANGGIGFEIALQLAIHGAKVYLACRSCSKASAALERILNTCPKAKVEFLEMNLASLHSVHDATKVVLSKESIVDILVCNAGIIAREHELSEDGVEMDFQVNYLGTTS